MTESNRRYGATTAPRGERRPPVAYNETETNNDTREDSDPLSVTTVAPVDLAPLPESAQLPNATGDRWAWPYLNPAAPAGLNGRETGAWVLGHLGGRALHGEPGLRCVIEDSKIAGAVTVLVVGGATVSAHGSALREYGSTEPPATCFDVWFEDR